MSSRHCAAEGRRTVAVAHLAFARRQKAGNGILGCMFMKELVQNSVKRDGFILYRFFFKILMFYIALYGKRGLAWNVKNNIFR